MISMRQGKLGKKYRGHKRDTSLACSRAGKRTGQGGGSAGPREEGEVGGVAGTRARRLGFILVTVRSLQSF